MTNSFSPPSTTKSSVRHVSSIELTLCEREELLSSSMDKVVILKRIQQDCKLSGSTYRNKYTRTKRIDDAIDITTALFSSTSIAFTIAGLGMPPFLIASASISGVAFVINRVQDKINFKGKYCQHNITSQQYHDLHREITAVLTQNNLTQQEYHRYIEQCFSKISMIESNQLF